MRNGGHVTGSKARSDSNSGRNRTLANEILRDRKGKKIGSIETDNFGIQTLRDAHGSKLGKYDPKRNETRDDKGSKVGTGNLLATLL
jgi:hypothetical protein